ncbi:unnamed protein product [Paramecium primaurelia]|uniref:Uncharacterized protein n=1 Tax=Paramecium primaurelia TaxID=5886 RepID=A0A8S1KFT1_PARPR|nr:unnamed protein product [Paramecium primaurelia]
MSTKVKISKRGQQYELSQKENYNPFSNLSLCPKSIIALAQSSYDPQLIEFTLNQLKTPCNSKHQTHLNRMRQIADKQENFVHGSISMNSQIETVIQYSDHSFYDQMETSHRKNSLHYFDESYQHF